MKTILVYFSDIHLTGEKPENEGAVIKAFCEDVKWKIHSKLPPVIHFKVIP